MTNNGRPFLRVGEVAELLGLSRCRIYQLVASRELPSTRVGGRLVVPRAAFDRWVARKADVAWRGVTGRAASG